MPDATETDPGATIATVNVTQCYALPVPPQGPTDARIGAAAPTAKAQIIAAGSGGVAGVTFNCDLDASPRLGDELVVTIAQRPRAQQVVLTS